MLVAVDAAPVNSADFLFAAGWFGVYPNVPSGLGAEGVGRVVQVGAGVDQALVGRRVLILPTFTFGTWADQTVVPADRLSRFPTTSTRCSLRRCRSRRGPRTPS